MTGVSSYAHLPTISPGIVHQKLSLCAKFPEITQEYTRKRPNVGPSWNSYHCYEVLRISRQIISTICKCGMKYTLLKKGDYSFLLL